MGNEDQGRQIINPFMIAMTAQESPPVATDRHFHLDVKNRGTGLFDQLSPSLQQIG